MSLKTWKAEFYPVTARNCPAGKELEHSTQKWRGLLPENLSKHGCSILQGDVHDNKTGARLMINAGSCALCRKFNDVRDDNCERCPLAVARAQDDQDDGCPVRCDDTRRDESLSPWYKYRSSQDASAMLYWLELAIKKEGR